MIKWVERKYRYWQLQKIYPNFFKRWMDLFIQKVLPRYFTSMSVWFSLGDKHDLRLRQVKDIDGGIHAKVPVIFSDWRGFFGNAGNEKQD
jgi:hypothetical protein